MGPFVVNLPLDHTTTQVLSKQQNSIVCPTLYDKILSFPDPTREASERRVGGWIVGSGSKGGGLLIKLLKQNEFVNAFNSMGCDDKSRQNT
jgi:hypothetical protein